MTSVGVAAAAAITAGAEGATYDYWREAAVNGGVYVSLGTLLVRRRPHHSIAWLLLGAGAASTLQLVAGQYSVMAQARGLPAAGWAAWTSALAQLSVVWIFVLMILLFPTGRVIAPRWRILLWVISVGATINTASTALQDGPIDIGGGIPNPATVEWAAEILESLGIVAGILAATAVAGTVLSVVIRFRRARGVERQQLKWFAFVVVCGIALVALPESLPFMGVWVWLMIGPAIASAITLSILRYGLYEIDRLINRAAVYLLLSGILAGLYLALVVTLQALLPTTSNQVAVAGSTLAVAALFRPFRSYIQHFIDRRFYQRKYDAEQTLRTLSLRLRDEVDLDTLRTEILTVVRGTMEPAQLSLWLKPHVSSTST